MPFLSPWRLILFGCSLVICGLALALSGQPVAAAIPQQPEPAEYVGADTCTSCHRDLTRLHATSRHALALQDPEVNKGAIKADFTLGEKERTVTFPDEPTARPFKAEDVAYVIGSGRYVQRYLYMVERNKYAVFPAEWNTVKKAWQPYVRGQSWPNDAAYDWTQNCAGCHTTGPMTRGRWTDDGVQCESCHGPGSTHVAKVDKFGSDATAGELNDIRAAIVTSPDAQICGQCHSFGTEPEKKLPYPVKYLPGGNLLDSGTFALATPDNGDHWWATGHAKFKNMQFNEWIKSGHANALTSLQKSDQADPACLTCHSADGAYVERLITAHKAGTRKGDPLQALTVQTAKFGVTCTSCHNPHSDGKIEFNLAKESYELCASCHQDTEVTKGPHHPVKEMFEGKEIVKEVPGVPSIHFSDKNGPRCATCHMPRVPVETFNLASHSLKVLLPGTTLSTAGLKDACTSCHADTTPEVMQKFISDSQLSTETRLKAATAALKDTSPAWVRDVIAFIEGDGSKGIHNHRYTAALLNRIELELGLVKVTLPGMPSDRVMVNPAECAQCHQTQHQAWLTSPHAKASLNDSFRKEFAAQKQPPFCMGCHASGYSANTGTFVFEGIVCSNCHTTEANAKHPPAPVKIANDALSCGSCHSGAHAPTYDEWLISKHNKAAIDCVDCHTPHNNGLRQGDVNATCGNCHKDATTDKIHMGANMKCTDCHMKRELDAQGVFVIKTGHSMSIDPSVCAACHGKTHVLGGKGPNTSQAVAAETEKVTALQAQVTDLENRAQSNWATGIAGGAVGVLIVAGIGFTILRRRKLL